MVSENSSNVRNDPKKKNSKLKRLAIALRQNLKRRKTQAKIRNELSKSKK